MTQAFLRPIEIVADVNDGFSIAHDGGGAQAKTLTAGTYANILVLLREFEIVCQTVDVDCDVYLNADWKIVITTNPAQTNEFTLIDEDLASLLGFTSATLADALTHTATYTPEYCWLPTYQSADREYWGRKQRDTFRGSMAQNGRLAGVTAGPTLNYRRFTYEFETAVKTYLSPATLAYTITSTYYPEQRRCFEYFMEQCRQVMPTTSGEPSPKGFYYLPDRSVYTTSTPTVAIPTSMDSGGINFDLASSPDRYVFCHADVGGAGDPDPSLPAGRDYFKINFEAHTATAPTWTDAA
jgi:hypothetical protein